MEPMAEDFAAYLDGLQPRAPRIGGFRVHGQEDDRQVQPLAAHDLQRVDAVQPRHRDVGDDEVRA